QTASASGADSGNYSSFTTATQNYTIDPRALTATAVASSSSTYGNALVPGAATLDANYQAGDVVNTTVGVDTSTLSWAGKAIAGTYTQTASASTGAASANSTFTPPTTTTQNDPIHQPAPTA